MKKLFFLPMVCIAAIALAACGNQVDPEPVTPVDDMETPVTIDPDAIDTEAIEEVAEEMAEEVEEAVAPEPVELDGPVPTGTSWQLGDYTLNFTEVDEVVDGVVHGKVRGSGGDIPAFLEDGMEFTYILESDGAIVIDTPQGEFRGTYDGETLILDDTEATQL